MTRLRTTLSVLAVLVLTTTALQAGPNRWTSSGPEGAVVLQIVTNPDDPAVAYALTAEGGIFKTSNGGDRWTAVNEGLPAFSITRLFMMPGASSTLYAAVGSVIFKSSDAGEHWSAAGRIGSPQVTSLAFDGVSGIFYASTVTGIFRSDDRGQTWEASSDLRGSFVTSVAVAPNGNVYAINGGGMWAAFRSSDQGKTWTFILGGSGGAPKTIAVDPDNSTIYLVLPESILASQDDGKTFQALPPINTSTYINSVVAAGDGHLYASTDQGVMEYSDHSHKWNAVGSSFYARAVAITASSPRRFYAAKQFGLVTSIEDQRNWIPADEGLPGAHANDVAVGSDPAIAYAATSLGAFKTEDSGESWHQVRSKLSANLVAVSPTTSDTAYASTDGPYPNAGLLKTTDGGATWKQVANGRASVLAVAPSDPATLYAALAAAMSRSTDGGETWKPVMNGLPLTDYDFYYGFSATSVAVDPSDSSTVYLAKGDGVFETNDGANWHQVLSKSYVRALAIEKDSSTVYAASALAGIVKSIGGGSIWTTAGLIDKRVDSLSISDTQPPFLYAGTADGRVYRSSNGGGSWTGLDDGLSRAPILKLAIDPTGQYLYAATAAGVYEYHGVHTEVRIERLDGDASRVPSVLALANTNAGFVVPVAGTATGLGRVFTTDLYLTNERDAAQDVIVAWLPQGGASDGVSLFRLTLPPSSDASGGMVILNDFAERFGIRGIGSLVVTAIDASGAVDPLASIGGSARIWMQTDDGRAPLWQSIAAARSPIFAGHVQAEAKGLRQDGGFRTNVGIVNLSGELHQFTIALNGERASNQFTTAVPPFSFVQMPIPDGDYGTLSIVVIAESSTNWLFYGSTIDRFTGEASTTTGN